MPSPTPSPTALPVALPGELAVDPSIDLGPISPYIFGTNYGPMQAVVQQRMPDVEEAGFTVLRFPAGAWSDQMDLIPFQIDMFMTFCKQVGGALPTLNDPLAQRHARKGRRTGPLHQHR